MGVKSREPFSFAKMVSINLSSAVLLFVFVTVTSSLSLNNLPPLKEDGNDEGNLWVLLAAGSDGYGNYRHQADVCHAYQVVKSHGVPEERIVVFMRDDIANNRQNKRPGEIINQPGGDDVYAGVSKDYTGDFLTAENFLKVMAGEEMSVGSKKTLKTGPNDRIFVFFSDHGAGGFVEFGHGTLKATDMIATVTKMHEDNKYKSMVFYWESCYSGSMFSNMPNDINVYATSASSPSESSYACYYDSQLGTFLGDLYSVSWLEDADQADLNTETLEEQYEVVKEKTDKSKVMEWGDLSMNTQTCGLYLGSQTKSPNQRPRSNIPRRQWHSMRCLSSSWSRRSRRQPPKKNALRLKKLWKTSMPSASS